MNLKRAALGGVSWIGSAQIIRQGLQFFISMILARLLSPREFGHLAMVTVLTNFAALFSDFGLGVALVQKLDANEDHFNAVFWVNIGIGVTLTSLFTGLAPFLARFYHEPALLAITISVSFLFTFSAFGLVQKSLLQRTMNFKAIAISELVSTFFAGAVAVSLAFSGLGVMSLIGQLYAFSLSNIVMLWIFSPWRPRFLFKIAAVRDLLHFSLNLLGFSAINYWSRNLDAMLIGRSLGSALLGVYTRAYHLMLLPVTQIVGVVSQVMIPALSSIQKDKRHVGRVYIDAVRSVAFLTFPLMLCLFVAAEPFILVVYGEKWREVVPVFRILCLLGMVQSITSTVGWIFQTQGRTDIQFRWGVVAACINISSFIIGLRWGIEGVAYFYAAGNVLFQIYPPLLIALSLIGLKPGAVFESVGTILLCSIMASLGVLALDRLFPKDAAVFWKIISEGVFGIVIYWSAVKIAREPSYLKCETLVRTRLFRWSGISRDREIID